VEIASVEGDRVTLRQPLRFDVALEQHPRLRASREAELVRDSGIERVTLTMRRDRKWDALGLGEVYGWNGVFFEQVVHGFARELTVVDGHEAAGVSASKNVTLSDLRLESTGAGDLGSFPRGIAVREASHDVLLEDVEVDPRYWFRLRIEGSGHAVSRVRGPLRWIGGPSADAVLTDVTLVGAARKLNALPGPRVVAWGLHGTAASAAQPTNLYEAQKSARP
jgi:hypothetical protein